MDPLLLVTIFSVVILAFGIGSNDETFSPVVGAGTLSVRKAAILGGILAIIGTVFLSRNVGETIGTDLLAGDIKENYDLFMLLAVVLATALLMVLGSSFGLPLSTTHVVVSAMLGIAVAYSLQTGALFTTYLNPVTFLEIILSWIISPILGYFGAWGTYLLMQKYVYKRIKGLDDVDRTERYASFALLATVIVTQLSRGGNDAAKATGILYWLAADAGGWISDAELQFCVWMVAIAMGLGLFILGRKVLRRVGTSLVELRPTSAFSLQLFVAVILTVCTIWGLPLSGTHMLIFAMLGIRRGQEMGMEKQQRRALRRILFGWGITFPLGIICSAGIYNLLEFFKFA
jgi:PiT family inorganic phosphate transporter